MTKDVWSVLKKMRNTSILQLLFFGKDPRVELIHQDAAIWIGNNKKTCLI